MKTVRVCLAVTSLVAASLSSRTSSAQAEDNAAIAEALFQQAQKLITEGKISEACVKFAESDRLDPGLGTKLSTADCYEREGKLAKSWALFTEIIPLAQQAKRKDREKTARERADKLAPRVPKLTITMAGADPAKVEVLRDGVVLGSATFGLPLPIDPGKHVIVARGAGFKEWSTEIDIDKEGQTFDVKIPALEIAEIKPPPPPPPPPPTPPPPSSGGRGLIIGGAVVGGLGLVGIGLGSYFGVQTQSEWDEALTHCNRVNGKLQCNETGGDLAKSAQSNGNISTIAFIGGGVVLAAGAGMLIAGMAGGKKATEKTGIHWVAPSFDGKNLGFLLQGRFR